ncbi:hypothetical protein LXL04_001216 [Taraxacum kok-saghyz]
MDLLLRLIYCNRLAYNGNQKKSILKVDIHAANHLALSDARFQLSWEEAPGYSPHEGKGQEFDSWLEHSWGIFPGRITEFEAQTTRLVAVYFSRPITPSNSICNQNAPPDPRPVCEETLLNIRYVKSVDSDEFSLKYPVVPLIEISNHYLEIKYSFGRTSCNIKPWISVENAKDLNVELCTL